MSRKKARRTAREIARDYALYVFISFVFIAVLLWGARSETAAHVWLSVFLSGLVLFGTFIPAFRPLWKQRKFWAFIGLALVLHIAGWTLLVTHVSPWRGIYVKYLVIPELLIMMALGNWMSVFFRRGTAPRTAHLQIPPHQ